MHKKLHNVHFTTSPPPFLGVFHSAFASMPFWKKRDSTGDASASAAGGGSANNGSNGNSKEKVNYKARLEHKQYLVRKGEKYIILDNIRFPGQKSKKLFFPNFFWCVCCRLSLSSC